MPRQENRLMARALYLSIAFELSLGWRCPAPGSWRWRRRETSWTGRRLTLSLLKQCHAYRAAQRCKGHCNKGEDHPVHQRRNKPLARVRVLHPSDCLIDLGLRVRIIMHHVAKRWHKTDLKAGSQKQRERDAKTQVHRRSDSPGERTYRRAVAGPYRQHR